MNLLSNTRPFLNYICNLAIFVSVYLLTLTSINYIADAGNLFRPSHAVDIAKLLAENWNVANVGNYDERSLQKHYVELIEERKEIVAVGSSRSLQIQASHVGTLSFFNSSVTGASLEDLVGIYYFYRRNDLLPKVLLIGLEPWFLNRHHGQTRWKAIGPSVEEATKLIGVPLERGIQEFPTPSYLMELVFSERHLELFSPSYFQHSLGDLFTYWTVFQGYEGQSLERLFGLIGKVPESDFYATDRQTSTGPLKRFDGSLVYPLSHRSRTIEEVAKRASGYAKWYPPYSMANFDRLDPDLKIFLQAFLDLLRRDGVRPVFLLPPYHPKAYQTLSQDYPIVKDVETYYRTLAAAHHIPLLGSFDPNLCECTESDFFDPVHPKPSAIRRILSAQSLLASFEPMSSAYVPTKQSASPSR